MVGHSVHISEVCDQSTFVLLSTQSSFSSSERLFQFTLAIAPNVVLFFWSAPSPSLFICSTGMTGNYLLTNPLLRPHDTNTRYNNLLAESIVCSTASPPAFHSPGALWGRSLSVVWENPAQLTRDRVCNEMTAAFLPSSCMHLLLVIASEWFINTFNADFSEKDGLEDFPRFHLLR